MIIHRKLVRPRQAWPVGEYDTEGRPVHRLEMYEVGDGRTACSKVPSDSWARSGETNVLVDNKVFEYHLWQENNGTLPFEQEVCQECLNRNALGDLANMEL